MEKKLETIVLVVLVSLAPLAILPIRSANAIIYNCNKTFIETMQINNIEYNIGFQTEYKIWANGTIYFHGSAKTKVGPGTLNVNFTKVMQPMPIESESRLLNPMSTDPMPKQNIWGLLFALYPGNASNYVRYDHPDTYDTYYPFLWNYPWQLWGEHPYETTKHVHLSIDQVDQLEAEQISKSQLLGYIYAGIIGGTAPVVGWALGTHFFPWLALALGISGTGVGIIIGIGLLCVGIIYALLAQWAAQNCGSVSAWVSNVLRLNPGDAYMWWWGFVTKLYPWIEPNYYPGPWEWYSMPFRGGENHDSEWKQSWGSERLTAVETIHMRYQLFREMIWVL